MAISQLPLLTLFCPSHEKQPSRKDTVSAIYCTVTNYSRTQWLKITNIYFHAVPVGQETRRSLVGSSEGLKVSHKDTVGVPAGVGAISDSTWGGSASKRICMIVDKPWVFGFWAEMWFLTETMASAQESSGRAAGFPQRLGGGSGGRRGESNGERES